MITHIHEHCRVIETGNGFIIRWNCNGNLSFYGEDKTPQATETDLAGFATHKKAAKFAEEIVNNFYSDTATEEPEAEETE